MKKVACICCYNLSSFQRGYRLQLYLPSNQPFQLVQSCLSQRADHASAKLYFPIWRMIEAVVLQLLQAVTGQSIKTTSSNNNAILLCGVGKMFIGELVEEGEFDLLQSFYILMVIVMQAILVPMPEGVDKTGRFLNQHTFRTDTTSKEEHSRVPVDYPSDCQKSFFHCKM